MKWTQERWEKEESREVIIRELGLNDGVSRRQQETDAGVSEGSTDDVDFEPEDDEELDPAMENIYETTISAGEELEGFTRMDSPRRQDSRRTLKEKFSLPNLRKKMSFNVLRRRAASEDRPTDGIGSSTESFSEYRE